MAYQHSDQPPSVRLLRAVGSGEQNVGRVAGLAACRRVVAVTLLPRDVLVDAGGLLRRLLSAGTPVDLLVLTDDGPARLAARRYERLDVSGVVVHRLGLVAPAQPRCADDIAGALSELVGFAPERGVYVLGPTLGADDASDAVAAEAARRVAAGYRLRLISCQRTGERAGIARHGSLRLQLSSEEWGRKIAGLGERAAIGPIEEFRVSTP